MIYFSFLNKEIILNPSNLNVRRYKKYCLKFEIGKESKENEKKTL